MKFNKKFVKEDLVQVELYAEGKSEPTTDNSTNTGACKNNTSVNVNGCVK
jgi:hypothetical protein